MKKLNLLLFCLVCLLSPIANAEEYYGEHFTIISNLPTCFVKLLKRNGEVYYKNLNRQFFRRSWSSGRDLTIYYTQSESESLQLSILTTQKRACYLYRLDANSQSLGWTGLFRGITKHFIDVNYEDAPSWFREGLSTFFSEQGKIVNDQLVIESAEPGSSAFLKEEIEQGRRPSIKRLFSSTSEQFENWQLGRHFAASFFYWLYQNKQLKQYLDIARRSGYEILVLEELTGKSFRNLNIELLKFMKKEIYAAAYLNEGLKAEAADEKMQAFLKALELKPDYQAVQIELALYYRVKKDYEKYRQYLEPILSESLSTQFRPAAELMGNMYYKDKDYQKALEYYLKSWEYCVLYEYKYKTAYKIANCYYYLKDERKTAQWYQLFLENNFEHAETQAQVDYAKKYLEETPYR
ncbi:MAG: tetratricopeptide repeat protein [Planctomycetota bacterium]|jgi:hypothetical protein